MLPEPLLLHVVDSRRRKQPPPHVLLVRLAGYPLDHFAAQEKAEVGVVLLRAGGEGQRPAEGVANEPVVRNGQLVARLFGDLCAMLM